MIVILLRYCVLGSGSTYIRPSTLDSRITIPRSSMDVHIKVPNSLKRASSRLRSSTPPLLYIDRKLASTAMAAPPLRKGLFFQQAKSHRFHH
jgi:hypothetical protein